MFGKSLRDILLTALLLIAGASVVQDRLTNDHAAAASPRVINAAALGKSYRFMLATTYADGWVAAAKALEDGKTIQEAQQMLQDTWKKSRNETFRTQLRPSFTKILPEGTEPASAEQRTRVATFWRSFAAGLRGTR